MIGVVLVGLVVASLLGTSAAAATRVQRKGSCTLDPGHWVLTVQKARVAGKLSVTFVVQGTVPMQSWQVAISDNNIGLPGANLGSGKKGIFTFSRTILNRPGADHIVVFASDGPSSCTGNVTY